MIQDYAVRSLIDAGAPETLVAEYFDSPQTFVVVRPGTENPDPMLPHASYAMTFASYAAMATAATGGSIPGFVRYLLYDNEQWAATPVAEQQDPFFFAGQAEKLAHAHGYGFILTIAANISTVLSRSYDQSSKFVGYLALHIPALGAKLADVYEIQAQQMEGQSGFPGFVASSVAEARAANPSAVLLAGLSTTAPGQDVTAGLLLERFLSTRQEVSGYWLNIPGQSGSGPEHPEVAVEFLEQLAPKLGLSG